MPRLDEVDILVRVHNRFCGMECMAHFSCRKNDGKRGQRFIAGENIAGKAVAFGGKLI